MKNFLIFEDFIDESITLSYKEVINHIKDITPDPSDYPDYFFTILKKEKPRFQLKKLKIADILKNDDSVREYVKSGEERYGKDKEEWDYTPYDDELDYPIVVYKGKVLDGYSRISTLYKNKEKLINAYTNI